MKWHCVTSAKNTSLIQARHPLIQKYMTTHITCDIRCNCKVYLDNSPLILPKVQTATCLVLSNTKSVTCTMRMTWQSKKLCVYEREYRNSPVPQQHIQAQHSHATNVWIIMGILYRGERTSTVTAFTYVSFFLT